MGKRVKRLYFKKVKRRPKAVLSFDINLTPAITALSIIGRAGERVGEALQVMATKITVCGVELQQRLQQLPDLSTGITYSGTLHLTDEQQQQLQQLMSLPVAAELRWPHCN